MRTIKLILFLLITFFSSTFLQAQTTSDVFDEKVDITWLGVDFSEMKFIGPASGWGSESTKSPSEMRDTYFLVWNQMIQKEAKAFKLEEAIHRDEVTWASEVTEKVNSKTNKKEIFSEFTTDYQTMTVESVKKMTSLYDLKGKTGIGFVLICDGMNKYLEEATYWATFIDMKTKKVLFTKQVFGKAGGFGFRNYWLGSIKNVFKTMKREFKNWD